MKRQGLIGEAIVFIFIFFFGALSGLGTLWGCQRAWKKGDKLVGHRVHVQQVQTWCLSRSGPDRGISAKMACNIEMSPARQKANGWLFSNSCAATGLLTKRVSHVGRIVKRTFFLILAFVTHWAKPLGPVFFLKLEVHLRVSQA